MPSSKEKDKDSLSIYTTSTATTNPFSDTHQLDDRSSINHSLLPNTYKSWKTSPTLRIDARGKAAFAFPTPVRELEIPIFSADTLRYISIRPQRRSGSCALFEGDGERRGRELASTKYVWGPGRNPVVRITGDEEGDGKEEFDISKKSIWNRTHGFTSPHWGSFEWRYAGRTERKLVSKQFGTDINTLLVLEKTLSSDGDWKEDNKLRVAMLIRGEGARTEGTRSSDAGNGGLLKMCLLDEDGERVLDEVCVVVTCLDMLKKEVDRARGRQVAMMSHGGGGP